MEEPYLSCACRAEKANLKEDREEKDRCAGKCEARHLERASCGHLSAFQSIMGLHFPFFMSLRLSYVHQIIYPLSVYVLLVQILFVFKTHNQKTTWIKNKIGSMNPTVTTI
jgi:hypothetical protein